MTSEDTNSQLNIVQSAPIGICILNAATLVTEMVNEAFLQVAGKPYEAIYGKYYWDSFAEAAPYYEAALAGVVKEGKAYRADEVELMLVRHGKEEPVFVTFVYEPVKDANGVVQKVSIWVLENTVQVNARSEVQKLNEELATSNEEIRATNEELSVTIDRLTLTEEQLQVLNEELTASNTELSVANDNLNVAGEELRAGNEELLEIQHSLEQSRQLLDIAMQAGGIGTYTLNFKNRTLVASPRMKEYFGFLPDEEMPFEAAYMQIAEEYRDLVIQEVESVFAEGNPFVMEYPVIGYHDNRRRWIRSVGKVHRSEDGTLYSSGAVVDITEQVEARQTEQRLNEELTATNEELRASNEELLQTQVYLQQSRHLLETAAEAGGVGTFIINQSGRMLTASPRLKELFGYYPDEEMLFDHAVELISEEHRSRVIKSIEAAFTEGKPYLEEYTVVGYHDRRLRWLRAAGRAETNSLDGAVYFSGSIVDITEQVAARNLQLRVNEELTTTNENLSFANEELNASNDELLLAKYNLLESNRLVSESEERFRNMAESTEVFIGISDETGNAIYFNKIWSDTTGRDNKALLEYGWADLVHPDDIERAMHNYREAIENKAPFTNEFRVLTKEGKYIWLFVQGIPRVQTDGSFAGHIGSAFDITERKKDDQRKSDFIGMVSHEMKTPLTSLSGYLQVLQMMAKGEQNNPTLMMLDKATNQIGKMTNLINGFLNVARLESGKIQIDKTRFDLAQLVKESEEDVQSTIKSHRIIFHPVETVWVSADHDKIGQVITNLISNAVKYSPANTEIVVSCLTGNGCATISVKDAGMGIKPEDQPKLFDRYYRVNHDHTTSPAGFGIGLYLCSEIIQRHDGKIWVESEAGKGSTFSFSLPVVS